MKNKKQKQRNMFTLHAIKRKAGSHAKPYKALRNKWRQEGWDD